MEIHLCNKDQHIVGEAGDFSAETVSSWIKIVQGLTEAYSIENIWNMGKTGCSFKALPETGLVQKGKQNKRDKKAKQRLIIAFEKK